MVKHFKNSIKANGEELEYLAPKRINNISKIKNVLCSTASI